ncbi:MAG: amidase family protein [Rubrivivax sp.]
MNAPRSPSPPAPKSSSPPHTTRTATLTGDIRPRATDLAEFTAAELVSLYHARSLSPVEATQAVLARIDRLNPRLNAFCHLAPEEALAAAQASEERWMRGEPRSVLDGVPCSIKDLILTKGWPTLRGSFTVDANQPWTSTHPSPRGCAKAAWCSWARRRRRSLAARARRTRRRPASRATRGTG